MHHLTSLIAFPCETSAANSRRDGRQWSLGSNNLRMAKWTGQAQPRGTDQDPTDSVGDTLILRAELVLATQTRSWNPWLG